MDVVYMPDGAPEKKRSKALDRLAGAGFDNIALDLKLYCPSYELEHREEVMETMDEYPDGCFASVFPERLVENADKFISQCRELHMKNTVGAAPSLPWDTKRADLEWLVYEISKQSILACIKAECRYIIVEPLIKKMETEEEWKKNADFYLSLTDNLAEGISILIPNHYSEYNGHLVRGTFSDPYRLAEFVDELNGKAGNNKFGLCIDIRICSLVGQNFCEFMHLLQGRVKAVVIRQNDAESQMDWLGVIRGLRKMDFDGQLIFDFRDTSGAYSHLLRADFDIFIKKVVDYFSWQISMEHTIKKYDKRVMFGAGKMFSNYMKHYGKEYPPLFTCDNNPDLWGTVADGIEVKNPEELRNIPKDCAVFICNVYYREIEEQLRKMGIQNRIEYYNDEYLPFSDFESERNCGRQRNC
ncbi:MAG: hypothetical protein J6J79_00270 [Lachnospiraceae bacterium]|nr:hypothetical protein [Lachnospiraceae bacterium]